MTVRVASWLLLVLTAGSLQGCFPIVSPGNGAGVMMAQDRREKDVYLEDQKIVAEATDLIYGQFKTLIHVNVTSFNHNVLISGEVPDEATNTTINNILNGIKNVRDVNNELAISATSSLASRSNDSLITSNVKLRYVNNGRFNPDHIKVVTENGTVYLLGIVNHSEADAAADVTSTARGVQRVVKIFEYLD
jgi:osmotically-inducible protein OsmY